MKYLSKIKKYVRKTNIVGGSVADVVDSLNQLTQEYLEWFRDGELIFVREKKAIYKVKSKEELHIIND